MAKKKISKKQSATTSPAPYPGYKDHAKLLAATTDEQLGKAYRQREESNLFLSNRGMY